MYAVYFSTLAINEGNTLVLFEMLALRISCLEQYRFESVYTHYTLIKTSLTARTACVSLGETLTALLWTVVLLFDYT